ncbi:kinase-like domain-containing protein [Annulohypoxylon truncatum]|uniref:kinase-like domain-containing protein n=1 Tax=Annulohypoxylon truncatum TaxID=327061 RepID=UPI002007D233|nr:kinase-like domain-containing protein [Annulohypoxylon truncatum]KAI1215152.1 kinase-like domain-containing protein [Annulohypoxylon truncatum]
MLSLVRSALSPAARSSSSRLMMSTLAPGRLLQGAKWNYQLLEPVIGDKTHRATIYKAKVNPRDNDVHAPQWAIIKAANDETTKKQLDRELKCYGLPNVASTPIFRQMYDKIDDNTIALEWLDNTLQEVKYEPNMHHYALIEKVLHAALTGSVILGDHGYVDVSYKPSNILISGMGTNNVTVKLGDFGQILPVGVYTGTQPYAMRAPEVFCGKPCTALSQVWSTAAMILVWMRPGVLGIHGSKSEFLQEAWCMAKIKRLFPDQFAGLEPEDSILEAIITTRPELRTMQTFKGVTHELGVAREVKDVLRIMFTLNWNVRPSASAILALEEFHALKKLVGGCFT